MNGRTFTEANSHLARHGEVLILTLSGQLTLRAFEAAMDRVSREPRPVALVIDLLQAALQSDWDDEMGALERFCLAARVDCAMVVPKSMLLYVQEQGDRAACLGIAWFAFLHMEHALQWGSTRHPRPLAFRPPQPAQPLRYEHPAPPLLQ